MFQLFVYYNYRVSYGHVLSSKSDFPKDPIAVELLKYIHPNNERLRDKMPLVDKAKPN